MTLPHDLIIDLFAGGGGASTGIFLATGRHPDIAVNHSRNAIAMHKANHPSTHHLCASVWEVDPREVCGRREVAFLWASPDCFPADTMVLTRQGYRPIQDVRVGDDVLTHRLRWRRVTATWSARRPLIKVVGRGHPGLLVSAEHPVYARRRSNMWVNDTRRYVQQLSKPEWTPAAELGSGHYWGSPSAFPAAEVPAVSDTRPLTADDRLLWLAGRYVADGWTRLTEKRAEVVITCGHNKIKSLRTMLRSWPRSGARCGAHELAWHERSTATAYQFVTNHRHLVRWLRDNFGHRAQQKTLPGWLLGISQNLRAAFLAGYVSGDGTTVNTVGNAIVQATTVSPSLAYGLKALVSSLGFSPSVYRREDQNNIIQGRKVNVRPIFEVRWRTKIDENHRQTERLDGIEWAPVRKCFTLGDEPVEVFNLSVEDDESYVAEGIVVHNCTHFSRAKGGKPRESGRRSLANVVVEWARAVLPRIIMLENVEEFSTWGPLLDDGKPCPARKGEDFRAWVTQLEWLGYRVEWRSLVAADYGAPTSRKRLFLVARCDGQAIAWPQPTHGPGRPKPWRTAAEIIDWSVPAPSIFERSKPLAETTQRRIARGLRRFVLETGQPFIATVRSTEPSLSDGAKHALVAAWLAKHYGGVTGHGLNGPIGTVTTVDHHSLSTAVLRHLGDAGAHRANVCAFLVKYYGTSDAASVAEPLDTVTTRDRFGLVTTEGIGYEIADIRMRMLTPRELFAAQGFPSDYDLLDGQLTKTAQIALAGNSVCPDVAAALVAANLGTRART